MFGLSKREQRWKAEQKAAETLVALAQTIIESNARVRIAEANAKLSAMSCPHCDGITPRGELLHSPTCPNESTGEQS